MHEFAPAPGVFRPAAAKISEPRHVPPARARCPASRPEASFPSCARPRTATADGLGAKPGQTARGVAHHRPEAVPPPRRRRPRPHLRPPGPRRRTGLDHLHVHRRTRFTPRRSAQPARELGGDSGRRQRRPTVRRRLTREGDTHGPSLARPHRRLRLQALPRSDDVRGPRTMEQFKGQLAGADVELDQAVLDRIDEAVAPGTTINPVDDSFSNPALEPAARRR